MFNAFNQIVAANNKITNGYIAVRNSKGLYGVIDSTGKRIYPVMFEQIGGFNPNGLSAVKRYKKWGYANEKVKLKINYKYEYAGDFEYGTAKVKSKGLFGMINPDGKFVIPAEYESIEPFEQSLLLVKKEGKFGVINRNNEPILAAIYDGIEAVSEEIIQFTANDKMAYYNFVTKSIIYAEPGFSAPSVEATEQEIR